MPWLPAEQKKTELTVKTSQSQSSASASSTAKTNAITDAMEVGGDAWTVAVSVTNGHLVL